MRDKKYEGVRASGLMCTLQKNNEIVMETRNHLNNEESVRATFYLIYLVL